MTRAGLNSKAMERLAFRVRELWPEIEGHMNGVDPMINQLQQLPHRNCIDRSTLFKIAREKSPRKAGLVMQNDQDNVLAITELAFKQTDDVKAIQLLCVLDGVDVPTASAVLSWMFPQRWPVIDRRAWQTLFGADIVRTHCKGIGLGGQQWAIYLDVVQALASELSELELTPQRVDRVLYALADPRFAVEANGAAA